MSKAKEVERPAVLLGRPSNNVSIGIVGMPNIGKCWAAGTKLYKPDGNLISVEEVKEGDRLMGDDGTVRTVEKGSLSHGFAPMYTVIPTNVGIGSIFKTKCAAVPFTVNGDHILVLRSGTEQKMKKTTMTVDAFMRLSESDQNKYRCFHSSEIEFQCPAGFSSLVTSCAVRLINSPVIPLSSASPVSDLAFLIGVWYSAVLSKADSASDWSVNVDDNYDRVLEIVGSPEFRCEVVEYLSLMQDDCKMVIDVLMWLRESVATRRSVISGFLYMYGDDNGTGRVSHTDKKLLKCITTIALSIGANVSGITRHAIPGFVSMSIVLPSSPNSLTTEYKFTIESEGKGEYYGFAVDGNHRLLLSDFTVTHNSSLFNCLSNLNVPAENYPFCTIDPSNARVAVPDDRFDFLCETFKPSSKVPAVLTITDIAGLVKGANEGKGLGNAFLSHIQAVDAIYHLVRAFKDKEIEHVEGSVDPIRDLDIISEELILKDYQRVKDRLEVVTKAVTKAQDKSKKQDMATLTIAEQLLSDKKDIRSYKWKPDDIDVLNELQLLTAKPVVYLVNIGEDEYYQQKNKWLGKIKEWTVARDPSSKVIPFSVVYEAKLTALPSDADRKAMIAEMKVPSQLPKIITSGYHALDLIHYFTAGEDEVRGWTVKRGTLAPAAAGVIHTDFQKAFIAAEVMAFDDFKEAGSESAVKAAGKYRTKGKDYLVNDGDILFFKHNAGGAKKK